MIPAIFEVYNQMHLFGNREQAKFSYVARLSGTLSGDKPGYASECIQCGECLEKCPQSIQIPDILEDVAVEMEDPGMEDRLTFVQKMFKAEKHL